MFEHDLEQATRCFFLFFCFFGGRGDTRSRVGREEISAKPEQNKIYLDYYISTIILKGRKGSRGWRQFGFEACMKKKVLHRTCVPTIPLRVLLYYCL